MPKSNDTKDILVSGAIHRRLKVAASLKGETLRKVTEDILEEGLK